MIAFRIAIAISRSRSAEETQELCALLAIACDLDDHEARQQQDILAMRRAKGFLAASKPIPLTDEKRQLLSEMKDVERDQTLPHLRGLDPSSILEFVEIDLVTALAFWSQVDGPTKEVDAPIIEAINHRRERLLSRIKVFRRSYG